MVQIIAIRRKKGSVFVVQTPAEEYEIDKKTLAEYALFEGMQLPCEQFAGIYNLSQQRRAYQRAVWLLSRKAYCSIQLEQKLLDVCTRDIARATVQNMQQLGFINDEDYACKLAQELLQRKHYGERRVLQELCRRGISKESAMVAIAQAGQCPQEHLQALIQKKYLSKIVDKKGREKVYAALIRMGYGFEESRKAVEQVLQNQESNEEERYGESGNDLFRL